MDERPSVRQGACFEDSARSFGANVIRRASSGNHKSSVAGPTTVVIQVSATGSGRWTDELGSAPDSVDCAVDVGLQQQEVKQLVQPPRRKLPKWLRRLMITTIVLGIIATAILVPMSLVVGFNNQQAPTHKLLPPPTPTHRIVFAFSGSATKPTADSILPAAIAAQVTQWVVLPSSGVHLAAFSSQQALQQGMAVLANSIGLKYAVSDFELQPDRHVSSIIDPMQLFELSRLPTRQLLQQQQQQGAQRQSGTDTAAQQQQQQQRSEGSSTASTHGASSSSSAAAAPQASKLVATHLQRLAERKAKRRQLLLQRQSHASTSLPETAQQLADGEAPQHGERPGRSAASRLRVLPRTVQQAAAAGVRGSTTTCCVHDQQQGTCYSMPAAAAGLSTAGPDSHAAAGAEHPSGDAAAAAAAAAAGDSQLRKLHQYQPPAPPPNPEPQQRQSLQHIQRGGKGVAWHLTDAALNTREAWNITYGFDEIIVAVIDSGVELSHGGVGAAVWANAGEVAGDNDDNDGNGFVDDVMGWDFGGSCADAACTSCIPGPDPSDATGWGTHAAAVIAAQPEVASGTSGVAPGVRVMALKVTDCRAGTQLGDTSAQQLVTQGVTAGGTAGGTGSVRVVDGSEGSLGVHAGTAVGDQPAATGPVMLGSAALQALDYAVMNGAHIVLAAWQAGGIIGTSSSSQAGNATAVNGTEGNATAAPAAAAGNASDSGQQMQCLLGVEAAGSSSSSTPDAAAACVAAVQRLVFLDALRPLAEAGVLVVTMHPDDEDTSGSDDGMTAAAATAAIPCSLGLELSNVLCVGSSSTVSSKEALSSQVPAASYFEPLIYTMALNYSADTNNTDESQALPDVLSNSGAPDQESNTITNATVASRALLRSSNWVELWAPGSTILGGWAWGSHAVVSGGSAAAAVAAGAAALAWSSLGQSLGAEASAGAHEGLASLVKHMLIQGSTQSSPSRSGDSGSSGRGLDEAARPAVLSEKSSMAGGSIGGAGELNLLQSLKLTAQYTGLIQLRPSHISPSITSASNTLSYSWYISSAASGTFNTPSMTFVARKALQNPAFPLTDWEFFGYTAVVEVQGFVVVQAPGNYSLAVKSEDKFIVWLQDKWLLMSRGGAAVGLGEQAWVSTVTFTSPGYYKLRVIIYTPQMSSFDLQWQPPGSSSFSHIPHFVSFGRSQPLPLQLVDELTGHMLSHGASSSKSSMSSKVNSEHSSSSVSTEGMVGGAAVDTGTASEVINSDSSTAGGTFSDAIIGADSVTSGTSPSPSDSASDSSSTSNDGNIATAALAASQGASGYPTADYPALTQDQRVTADPAAAQQPYVAWSDPAAAGVPKPDGQAVPAAQQPSSSFSDPSSSDSSGGSYPGSSNSYGSDNAVQPSSSSGYPGSNSGSSNGFAGGLNDIFGMLFGWGQGAYERGQQPAVTAAHPGGSSSNIMAGNADMQQQQAVISGSSSSSSHPSRRSLHSADWLHPTGSRSVTPLPGVFSVAMTLEAPWSYRTLIPSLKGIYLRRSGILPGPGLEVSHGWQLQQQLLGYADDTDDRAGYGVVQGWLDWQGLNSEALRWLQGDQAGAQSPDSLGGVQVGTAGVQFELSCGSQDVQLGCSLHVDGNVVVGSLGETVVSSCVVPARRVLSSRTSSGGSAAAQPEHLMHAELLFTAEDVRGATLAVKSRPCVLASDGSVQLPGGSDGSFVPLTAAAGAPGYGLSAAAVAGLGEADVPGGFMRGMLCSVRATLPPPPVVSGTAAGAANSASSSSSSGTASTSSSKVMEKVVHLTVEQMQQAIRASGSSAAAPTVSGIGSSNDTHAEATAKAVAGTPGIAVKQLVPDWVAILPADALYGFTCGCYWNGSWGGNLSVGIRAGGSGTAGVYLNGWQVAAAGLLPLYGPSDIEVTDYSTWQQRQQLASGSSSADPLRWATAADRSGSASAAAAAAVDPAAAADVGYRPVQQLVGGSVFLLGEVDGTDEFAVPSHAGWHQLLVVKGEGMAAGGQVVVVAAVEGGGSSSSRVDGPLAKGWLPGAWEAWVPR